MTVYQSTVPVTLTIEEGQLSDLVFSTGALRWEWWDRTMEHDGGVRIWVAEEYRWDIPGGSETGRVDLTWHALAEALTMAIGDEQLNPTEIHTVVTDTCAALDAIGADKVLQVAVFGAVVFS